MRCSARWTGCSRARRRGRGYVVAAGRVTARPGRRTPIRAHGVLVRPGGPRGRADRPLVCLQSFRRGWACCVPECSGAGKTTLAPSPARQCASRRRRFTDDPGKRRPRGPPNAVGIALARVGSRGRFGVGAALGRDVHPRGPGNAVALRDVSPGEAFRRMVNSLSMPLWEPARCGRALEIVDAIVSGSRARGSGLCRHPRTPFGA